MIKNLTALMGVALFAVSCSHGVSRVQTRALTTPNPTTYTFPLPLQEVHAKAFTAFSIEHQVRQPVFGRVDSGSGFESIFSIACVTNPLFAPEIFKDPANAQDIYLHTFNSPFVLSSVYHGRNGGLPFVASFHLHLIPDNSDTVVTVTASDTEIVNGTKFGIGPCGPGQMWNWQHVAPTTVEEYTILRYLGGYLGVTNMPAVMTPTQ